VDPLQTLRSTVEVVLGGFDADAVTPVDAGALRTTGTRIGFADPAWGEGAGTDGCAPGRYPLVLGFAPTDDPGQGLVAAYAVVVLGPGSRSAPARASACWPTPAWCASTARPMWTVR
jgi:hypothetical protein